MTPNTELVLMTSYPPRHVLSQDVTDSVLVYLNKSNFLYYRRRTKRVIVRVTFIICNVQRK